MFKKEIAIIQLNEIDFRLRLNEKILNKGNDTICKLNNNNEILRVAGITSIIL